MNQELLEGILEALQKGFKPNIQDGDLVIPGWGFELRIHTIDKQGSFSGYVSDTSGG